MKPLDTDDAASSQAVKPSSQPLVLYVEDDEENWNVTQLRLEQHFHLIHAATDVQACELIRKHGAELHAILMDIELKGSELSGIDLTKAFRHKGDANAMPSYAKDLPLVHAPIVFVTAYGYRYKDVDLLAMGGNKVLEKPVDFKQLNLALSSFKFAGRAAP